MALEGGEKAEMSDTDAKLVRLLERLCEQNDEILENMLAKSVYEEDEWNWPWSEQEYAQSLKAEAEDKEKPKRKPEKYPYSEAEGEKEVKQTMLLESITPKLQHLNPQQLKRILEIIDNMLKTKPERYPYSKAMPKYPKEQVRKYLIVETIRRRDPQTPIGVLANSLLTKRSLSDIPPATLFQLSAQDLEWIQAWHEVKQSNTTVRKSEAQEPQVQLTGVASDKSWEEAHRLAKKLGAP